MFNKKCKLTDQQIQTKAEELISKMSLKEKVFLLSGNWNMLLDSVKYKRSYNPVPIKSHGSKRLGISPIAFTDGPRGVVMGNSTCFPVSMARAASFDRKLEREVGEAIGEEARAQGANYFGGVCVNLLMHPAGGRAQESYGEDPFLVGEMGAALVRGVQEHNVMACAKHYAVNNMENLRFRVSVDCSERTLREVYLPHFKKCVDAGCASLMGSYNRFREEQASESKYLLTDILRDEWGFEGFTITDFFFALRNGAKAMNAGMDMEMPLPVHFGLELKEAVKKGELKEEVLDQAILRVLKTLLTFENTEDPKTYDMSLVANAAHIALARKAAEESMVLIKNENQVLPLKKDIKKLLVIGHRDGNKPAYPFGYGLSYTSFAYGEPKAECTDDTVCITVPVENTGKRTGDEIVQVYVSVPNSAVERHVRELKGFDRVSLQPGEQKAVFIRIPLEELKYYDEKTKTWVLEKTDYDFLAGPSANPDVLATVKVSL